VALATVASLAVLSSRSSPEPAVTSVARQPAPGGALPACRAAAAAPQPDRVGIKGIGSLVAATDATVTVHLDAPAAGEPVELTATITEATRWTVNGADASRPSLAPGEAIAFAAEPTDHGYELLALETPPANGVSPATDGTQGATATNRVVDDAAKAAAIIAAGGTPTEDDGAKVAKEAAAGTTGDTTGAVKAGGTIVAVAPGALTLHVTEGPLAGQDVTATTGPGTTYLAGSTKCSGADLAAGDAVHGLLQAVAGGGYAAEMVSLD
jgi:hypothetical protein